MPSRHDALVDSARRWANIHHLATLQLDLAEADPGRDPEAVQALEMAAAAACKMASQKLRLLSLAGLDAVAANIAATTPDALRLAEAPLDQDSPGGGR